jgi:hypothetical protein
MAFTSCASVPLPAHRRGVPRQARQHLHHSEHKTAGLAGFALLHVAVDRLRREGGNAHCKIIGAVGGRVPNPISGCSMHRLASARLEGSRFILYMDRPGDHDGPLVKVRSLPRLGPTWRTGHAGDADGGFAGIHSADVFADRLCRRAGRFHNRRVLDQPCHAGGAYCRGAVLGLWLSAGPPLGSGLPRACESGSACGRRAWTPG